MKQLVVLSVFLAMAAIALRGHSAPPSQDINATIVNIPLPVTIQDGGSESVVRVPFQYEASVDNWTGLVNFPINIQDHGFTTADRLVIEYVSARLVIAKGSIVQSFKMVTKVGVLDPVTHWLSVPPSVATDSNENDIYVVNQPLRMYTDGDFGVTLSLIKNPPVCETFPATCDAAITVSGYIIPQDSPSLAP